MNPIFGMEQQQLQGLLTFSADSDLNKLSWNLPVGSITPI